MTTHELTRAVTWLGRVRKVDVFLAYPSVGQNHARIQIRKEGVFIEHIGSTNGVFINGSRIPQAEPVLLADGDVVLVGEAQLIFHA